LRTRKKNQFLQELRLEAGVGQVHRDLREPLQEDQVEVGHKEVEVLAEAGRQEDRREVDHQADQREVDHQVGRREVDHPEDQRKVGHPEVLRKAVHLEEVLREDHLGVLVEGRLADLR
tara:strand:- start:264 stop:617 length:354 start_codon:yes stop_codon:yes gene_type:complete